MRIIDVHCHLEREELCHSLDAVIAEAKAAGVAKMISASVEPHLWEFTRNLARGRDEVEFTIGLHPWIARPLDDEIIEKLTGAADFGAVAIGEIGLDTMIDSPGLDVQVPAFEAQLAIARDTDMPVVIHVRKAYGELYHSLKKIGLPRAGGYIHNFTGSAELARDFMRFDLSFSLGGVITYTRNRKRDSLIRTIYPERFLLETDAPDILPLPLRGIPNRPAYIIHALRAASEILELPEEKVADQTTANACRVLRLPV